MTVLAPAEQPDIFFQFPRSRIRDIPLVNEQREHLSLGFIEIGCQPKGKRSQLHRKRDVFYNYWQQAYASFYGLSWIPSVYRLLAHYDPQQRIPFVPEQYHPDVVICYQFITTKMLRDIDDTERRELERTVKDYRQKGVLEEILATQDAERLHDLIVNSRQGKIAFLRGKLAEIFALKDIDKCKPPEMDLYRNGDIWYINQHYRNGTEVDGILTFYNELPYLGLIENLRKLLHLEVKER